MRRRVVSALKGCSRDAHFHVQVAGPQRFARVRRRFLGQQAAAPARSLAGDRGDSPGPRSAAQSVPPRDRKGHQQPRLSALAREGAGEGKLIGRRQRRLPRAEGTNSRNTRSSEAIEPAIGGLNRIWRAGLVCDASERGEPIGRRLAGTTILRQFVGNLLAFTQGLHASALDRADMHEYVLAALIRLNESVTLLRVEPLDRSSAHSFCPSGRAIARPRRCWPERWSMFGKSSSDRRRGKTRP